MKRFLMLSAAFLMISATAVSAAEVDLHTRGGALIPFSQTTKHPYVNSVDTDTTGKVSLGSATLVTGVTVQIRVMQQQDDLLAVDDNLLDVVLNSMTNFQEGAYTIQAPDFSEMHSEQHFVLKSGEVFRGSVPSSDGTKKVSYSLSVVEL